MLEKGKILTLSDDNDYSIVDLFTDNNVSYIYLVDINNNANVIYGKVENDEVVSIEDVDELEKVIKMVNDNLHH